MSNDFESTGDLHRIKEHTISDDLIEGEIVDVDPDKAHVTVKRLTDGETFTQRYNTPKSWSDEYNFVRLVKSHGYNAASVELLVGDTVNVDISGRRGSIVIDEGGLGGVNIESVHVAMAGWFCTLVISIPYIPPIGTVMMLVWMGVFIWAPEFHGESDD